MFSTTTVPSSGFILSAHGRPMASNAPPGANGTTSRMVRVGYGCAIAPRETADSVAPPAARRRKVRRGIFMVVSTGLRDAADIQPDAGSSDNTTSVRLYV